MLGATDPSYIIPTIEYRDIERRRYTAKFLRRADFPPPTLQITT